MARAALRLRSTTARAAAGVVPAPDVRLSGSCIASSMSHWIRLTPSCPALLGGAAWRWRGPGPTRMTSPSSSCRRAHACLPRSRCAASTHTHTCPRPLARASTYLLTCRRSHAWASCLLACVGGPVGGALLTGQRREQYRSNSSNSSTGRLQRQLPQMSGRHTRTPPAPLRHLHSHTHWAAHLSLPLPPLPLPADSGGEQHPAPGVGEGAAHRQPGGELGLPAGGCARVWGPAGGSVWLCGQAAGGRECECGRGHVAKWGGRGSAAAEVPASGPGPPARPAALLRLLAHRALRSALCPMPTHAPRPVPPTPPHASHITHPRCPPCHAMPCHALPTSQPPSCS